MGFRAGERSLGFGVWGVGVWGLQFRVFKAVGQWIPRSLGFRERQPAKAQGQTLRVRTRWVEVLAKQTHSRPRGGSCRKRCPGRTGVVAKGKFLQLNASEEAGRKGLQHVDNHSRGENSSPRDRQSRESHLLRMPGRVVVGGQAHNPKPYLYPQTLRNSRL